MTLTPDRTTPTPAAAPLTLITGSSRYDRAARIALHYTGASVTDDHEAHVTTVTCPTGTDDPITVTVDRYGRIDLTWSGADHRSLTVALAAVARMLRAARNDAAKGNLR